MKRIFSLILSLVLISVSLNAFCVSGETVSFGDVNTDNLINNKDLGLLMQFLNDWDVVINSFNADVNNDGDCNNKDYGLLMQYLNGWDVNLGESFDDGLVNDGVDPQYYRGTTVKFAATLYPEVEGTAGVVADFEEKYGIDLQIVYCDYNNYADIVCGLIAAGNSPDIARSQGDFPISLSYLQPLDAARLDYDEPIWNQNMFDMSTFNGSPYLCGTNGNLLFNTDIVIYSKSLLRRAGANTPEEYDALGKWTWDGFLEIGRACRRITGGTGCSFYSRESALNMTGAGTFKLENGVFVNDIDYFTTVVYTRFAEAWQEGLIGWDAHSDLVSGKAGIITSSTWRLKNDGKLSGIDYNDLGFYRLPDYDQNTPYSATGCFVGWGLIKGAKNPVGAGLFLRHYLDCTNYNADKFFVSPEAADFFFDITDIDYKRYNPYHTYVYFTEELAGIDYYYDLYGVMSYNPVYIPSYMPSISRAVDKACDNFNQFIKENT